MSASASIWKIETVKARYFFKWHVSSNNFAFMPVRNIICNAESQVGLYSSVWSVSIYGVLLPVILPSVDLCAFVSVLVYITYPKDWNYDSVTEQPEGKARCDWLCTGQHHTNLCQHKGSSTSQHPSSLQCHSCWGQYSSSLLGQHCMCIFPKTSNV